MILRTCEGCGEDYEPFLLKSGCPSSLCPCCGYMEVVREEQEKKYPNPEFEIPSTVSRDQTGAVTGVKASTRPLRTWARPSRHTWFKDIDDLLDECGYPPLDKSETP